MKTSVKILWIIGICLLALAAFLLSEPLAVSTVAVPIQPSIPAVTPADSPIPVPTPVSVGGFVDILEIDPTLIVELKYASEDNFTGTAVYDFTAAVLREPTAVKLAAANALAGEHGYRIKVWDAYRPPKAQERLWEILPDPVYVAPPERGSVHSKGCAVDVTLTDTEGRELAMPSAFDEFTERACGRGAEGEARERYILLKGIMEAAGFQGIDSEWWHYIDTDAADYEICALDMSIYE